MDIVKELERLKDEVDGELERRFTAVCPQRRLLESMRYSLLAGGKRIRPVLTLKFCEAVCGDAHRAMPFALAIEMIHTYSLIHDDLPMMDDDDLRRGRPTNHRVFGECTAALAGDALQAAAFAEALSGELDAQIRVRAALCLAKAAGEMGMCGGQELDTAGDSDRSLEGLTHINDLKTGALLVAASVMGVIAGCGSEEQTEAAEKYAASLARAFQIRDDVLDVISDDATFGKSVGSDAENGKPTYASILGVEECGRLVRDETEAAKAALRGRFADTTFLEELADHLCERMY